MATTPSTTYQPLLLNLQQTLTQSVFSGLSGHLSQIPQGAALTRADVGQRLEDLTRLIAGEDPSTATQLLPIALEARTSGYRSTTETCYRRFCEIIAGAKAPSKPEKPLVDFDDLYDVSCKLLGPDEDGGAQWIHEGLRRLEVSNPIPLLSIYLNGRHRGPFVTLKRTKGDHFVVNYVKAHSPRASFKIEVPYTVTKPLTQDQLRYLIAKALMVHALRKEVCRDKANRYAQVHPDELDQAIPLSILTKSDKDNNATSVQLVQLGPPDLSAHASQLVQASRWLHRTSPVFSHYVAEFGKRDIDNVFFQKYRELDDHIKDLLNIPNAARMLGRSFSVVPPLDIRFLFQAEALNRPGVKHPIAIDGSIGEKQGSRVYVKANPETLSQLSGPDLIDIVVLGGIASSNRLGLLSGLMLSLESLRSKRGNMWLNFDRKRYNTQLSFDELMHRAHLRYIYSYRIPKEETKAKGDPSVEGDISGEAKLNFIRALGAVLLYSKQRTTSAQVAWQHVLGIRKWVIQDSGLATNRPFIESFQSTSWASLQVYGNTDRLTPLDWLFLLSRMDAAPNQALKTVLGDRDLLLGSKALKSANERFKAIASDRNYESFGTFDPRLRAAAGKFVAEEPSFYDNPAFAKATASQQQEYAKALMWFDEAKIPEAWKPDPSDSLATLRSKQRQMRITWHEDLPITTPGQAELVRHAENYWPKIMKLHEEEG